MSTPAIKRFKTHIKDCAILLGDCGPIFACGKSLGHATKLEAQFVSFKPADEEPWLGFLIRIPLGQEQVANEAAVFGVCHDSVPPPSSFQQRYEEAPEKLVGQFPDAKDLSYLTISFNDTKPIVMGYGRPFANVQDPQIESWVNGNQPVINGCTLLDALQLQQYHVVLPINVADAQKKFDPNQALPPFSFPYGSQSWNVTALKADIAANPGHKFTPTYMHPDNHSLLVAMTQPLVQDVMWLDDAVSKIYTTKMPGYFVSAPEPNQFYVIVTYPDKFMSKFKVPWRRLIKNTPAFNLHLYNSKNSTDPRADWDCQIMSKPAEIDELSNHEIQGPDLVLLVRRPGALEYRNGKLRGSDHPNWLSLEFDAGLLEAERKVKAISGFHVDAQPSYLASTDLPLDPETGAIAGDLTAEQYNVLEELCDRMSLHREVMRGAGFFDWMTAKTPRVPAWAAAKSPVKKATAKAPVTEASNDLAQVVEDIGNIELMPKGSSLRPLPTVNFLDIEDKAYVACIPEESLPEDCVRFRGYLSNRPLGLGIITTGAGFGKTTVDAAATLAMQAKLGRILCSGPTDEAILGVADTNKLIIRGYNPSQEMAAITSLLKDPKCGDDAVTPSSWKLPSRWKLNLSCAFWVLLMLRSPAAGRELLSDDHPFLHALQKRIDARDDLSSLRQFATGAITWEEYKATVKSYDLFFEDVRTLVGPIVENAEILCVTPADSENCKPFLNWKLNHARGVAIDGAARLSRGDLCCVWGNTLLPCFLFGDPRQLPPSAANVTDKAPIRTQYLNRF
ncbi:DNA helicase [Fusarium acuminatum]|uniref:DNA helicase n=1 Tax=Fusarium acuminatum TaxID=5515 RepID=A0ABZ2WXV9_9HYPO